jgi:transposase
MSIVQSASTAGAPVRRVRFRELPLQPPNPDWHQLDERLDRQHLARLILHALHDLDLMPLFAVYAGRGSAAYQPQRLLAAVLYELHYGHRCPAQWFRHAQESDPLRWLLGGYTPSRSAWYDFRDRIADVVLPLVQQVVRQAIADGFTPANRAAIDGTLIAANASRHQLQSQSTLAQHREQLEQATAAAAAAAVPVERPGWMAPTAGGRRQQSRRYRQAQDTMDQRQRRNGHKRASKRTAAEKIRISVGDPEAAVGRDKEKVYRPLYNVQLLDDLDSPLILAYGVFAQPNDAGLVGGLLRQVQEGCGPAVAVLVGDAGYAGGPDLAAAAALGATVYAPWQQNDYSVKKVARYYPKEAFVWSAAAQAYRCPAGERLELRGVSRTQRSGPERIELQQYAAAPSRCQECALRERCTGGKGARTISRSEHEELIEALRARMATAAGQALYKQRKQTVELANADVKTHRGLRRFSGHGLRRVTTEMGLVVLRQDLVALAQLRRQRNVETISGSLLSRGQFYL